MSKTLAVDVDSTIWDPGPWVCEAVLDVTGRVLDLETATVLTYLLDAYGEEAAAEIFDRVFRPDRVPERILYPGVADVLARLRSQRDVTVHFITENDPEKMALALEPWLSEHFGRDVGLTVTIEDRLTVLGELGAFGLVNDRPDVIARAADAGLWVAAMAHPWNRELVARRSDIHGFSDWQEVPGLLPSSATA